MTVDLVKDRPASRKSRVTRYAVDKKCDRCGGVIPAGTPARRWPLGRGRYLVHYASNGYSHNDVDTFTCCCSDCVEL